MGKLDDAKAVAAVIAIHLPVLAFLACIHTGWAIIGLAVLCVGVAFALTGGIKSPNPTSIYSSPLQGQSDAPGLEQRSDTVKQVVENEEEDQPVAV